MADPFALFVAAPEGQGRKRFCPSGNMHDLTPIIHGLLLMEQFMISKNILVYCTSVSMKRAFAHPIVALDTPRAEMKRGLAIIASPLSLRCALQGTPSAALTSAPRTLQLVQVDWQRRPLAFLKIEETFQFALSQYLGVLIHEEACQALGIPGQTLCEKPP